MNFLHLPGWTVTSVKESANDYRVEASCDEGAGFYYCTKCGEMFTKMYRHGSRKQLLMDLPVHGKRVGIELTRKRYRCTKCGVTFLQQLPDVDERSQMTRRLARYIEQQSIHRTFTSVAGDGSKESVICGVSNTRFRIAEISFNDFFQVPSLAINWRFFR